MPVQLVSGVKIKVPFDGTLDPKQPLAALFFSDA
jgi:hypothetical protein